MATAALAYSGITVKMLVDQRLDAQLSTMFMVDYAPGGSRIRTTTPSRSPTTCSRARSRRRRRGAAHAAARRFFWTGVGTVHAFYETRGERVLWLETSAPQPPNRHSYRFERDWDYLRGLIEDADGPRADSA